MKISLFERKVVVLTGKGFKIQNSYYLPDMAYGEFLIYRQLKPVYYISFVNSAYEEMSKYIKANSINADVLLAKMLTLNGQRKLSVKERCWCKCRFGKEVNVQYELEPFPISYWKTAKGLL
jgi:hypothetical protein